jgi:hypothetical protein
MSIMSNGPFLHESLSYPIFAMVVNPKVRKKTSIE